MSQPHDDRPRFRDDIVRPEYQHCFGCGEANPQGLHLRDVVRDGDVVSATLSLNSNLQGFPGLLHGGVSASALDEVMGYACRMLSGHWGATAKMELRYRRPLPDHGTVTLQAGVKEGVGGRRFPMWAKLFGPDGQVAVEADALFVPVPAQIAGQFVELDN